MSRSHRRPAWSGIVSATLAVLVLAIPAQAEERDVMDDLLDRIPGAREVRLAGEILDLLRSDETEAPAEESPAEKAAREQAEAEARERARIEQAEQNAQWNALLDRALNEIRSDGGSLSADDTATALVVARLLLNRDARVHPEGADQALAEPAAEAGALISHGLALDDGRFHLLEYVVADPTERPAQRTALATQVGARGPAADLLRLMDLAARLGVATPRTWEGPDGIFVALVPSASQPSTALALELLTSRRDGAPVFAAAPGSETRAELCRTAWTAASSASDPAVIALGAELLRTTFAGSGFTTTADEAGLPPPVEGSGRDQGPAADLARTALANDPHDVGWLFLQAAVEDETDGHLSRIGEWAAVEAVLAALADPGREERISATLRALQAVTDPEPTEDHPWRPSTYVTLLTLIQAPVGGVNRIPLSGLDPATMDRVLGQRVALPEPIPLAYDPATDLALNRIADRGLALARATALPSAVRAVGAAVAVHAFSRLTQGYSGDPAVALPDHQLARQIGAALTHLAIASERGWLAALPPAMHWDPAQAPALYSAAALALARTAHPPFAKEDDVAAYGDLARRLAVGDLDPEPLATWIAANTAAGDDLTFPPEPRWFPYALARKALEGGAPDPDGELARIAQKK